jgi:hypothetical protein
MAGRMQQASFGGLSLFPCEDDSIYNARIQSWIYDVTLLSLLAKRLRSFYFGVTGI